MWIFTKHGYYAIVKDYDDKDIYWIRTRIKADLENIIKALKFKNPEIIHKDYADYKFRLKITKKEFNELMLFFADELDYSNFKNMMDDNAEQRHKIFAYYEIYNVLAEHFDK
jgi:hypothetical protein